MDKEYFWLIVLFLSIGTLSIRSSFFFLYAKLNLSEEVKKMFTYIPAAVLPALVMPSVVFHEGSVEILGGNERLVALAVAVGVCYFSKSVVFTIFSGLLTLFFIT